MVVAKAREAVVVAKVTITIKVRSLVKTVANLIMMQSTAGIGLILKL
jgi:hypothetical protein